MSNQLQNRKTRKNTQENFRRRKISLISKADDLHRFFGADVFLVIRKKGKYCGYNSRNKPGWPPTKEELEHEIRTPADFDCNKGYDKAA